MRDEVKNFLQGLIVTGLLFLASASVSAQAKRIEFYKDSTSAVVSSSLRNYKDRKVFVIKVRPGQTLKTEQVKSDSAAHSITVLIKNPSGKVVGDADASCNNRKEITPTVAGDYTITIYECQKADAWRGRFRLKVTVK